MLSHPVVLLLVVATSDVDPVACMQELASMHHTPLCLTSGQYDNDSVQRVYVLVHDTYSKSAVDPRKEFDKVCRTFFFHSSFTLTLLLSHCCFSMQISCDHHFLTNASTYSIFSIASDYHPSNFPPFALLLFYSVPLPFLLINSFSSPFSPPCLPSPLLFAIYTLYVPHRHLYYHSTSISRYTRLRSFPPHTSDAKLFSVKSHEILDFKFPPPGPSQSQST
jgi:hypothetical protein